MRFEYFNPNPKLRRRKDGTPMKWHKGDCTTRAISKALDISWKEAFKLQCEKAMEVCDNTTDVKVTEGVLLDNGFKKGTIPQEFIQHHHRRPTVREVVEAFNKSRGKHKMVVNCTHHCVAAEGITLYDTWDSGDVTAWSFWYK